MLGGFEERVLLCFVGRPRPQYSVEVIRTLKVLTEDDVYHAAVDTTLKRLEKKGFLTSTISEPLSVRGGRRRRYYEITEAGIDELDDMETCRRRIKNGRMM